MLPNTVTAPFPARDCMTAIRRVCVMASAVGGWLLRILVLVVPLTFAPGGASSAAPRAEDGAPDLVMPPIRERVVTTRDVTSSHGVRYRLFVSAPKGAPPPGGFPVIYLLDGNAWFGVAASISRVFEYGAGPCLVVGIGYPVKSLWSARQREFDTTMVSTTPPDQPKWSTGGADDFLDFIVGTVKPQIEARFRIDQTRELLFGHSLNGLFVLHALYARPDAFRIFVAASPSIWWGDFAILSQETEFEKRPLPEAPPRVLVTVGSKEATFQPSAAMRATLLQHPEVLGGHSPDELMAMYESLALKYRMVDAARETAERLRAHGMDAAFIDYQDEEHNTEAPMAITRALEMLLSPAS